MSNYPDGFNDNMLDAPEACNECLDRQSMYDLIMFDVLNVQGKLRHAVSRAIEYGLKPDIDDVEAAGQLIETALYGPLCEIKEAAKECCGVEVE